MTATDDDIRKENRHLRGIINGLLGSKYPIEGLSPLQARLVRAIQAAHGKVVSRRALYEALYLNAPYQPVGNGIRVTLWNIKKRRPDIAAKIQTVWGHGLRWREKP